MCDTNRPVQSQKDARSLKFRILVEEELYYSSSENKGADQLRSYCEADLRLCFRIGENPVFSRRGSIDKSIDIFPLGYIVYITLSYYGYIKPWASPSHCRDFENIILAMPPAHLQGWDLGSHCHR